MQGVVWVIGIVVFLLLEAATYQFICIWFAGGALGALIFWALGFGMNVQISAFFIVSALLLVLTRPLVRKITANRKVKTNVDVIPGKICLVTEEINNLSETGKAKLDGMEWTARSKNGEIIKEGSTAEVVEVSGVKLIVKERISD